jgi:hypothetical protein
MNFKTMVLFLALSRLWVLDLPAQTANPPGSKQQGSSNEKVFTLPGRPLGIAWGFLYGYLGTPAERYLPQLRELGGEWSKVYLFWNQLEPEKGKYDWKAVDEFVNQLRSPDEGLVALFSSSQWGSKRPSFLLPPAPPKNPDDYYQFVKTLVRHCHGRVRYWQNDAEPNNPIYWSGTKEEYVDQLKVFYKAVKDADPTAIVVVGGYDGLFGPPGAHPFPNQQAGLDFFDYVLKEGQSAFDVFDLRLYGDPYTIVARVDIMREKMRAFGYNKPIVCTEYGGPAFFQFAENRKYFSLLSAWNQSIVKTGSNGAPQKDNDGANQIARLYDRMTTLAPETQMFMLGCSPELEGKYDRIQARGLVMRNLFALAAGVQKTMYWQLADLRTNRDNMMTLMYGKIGLLGYDHGVLRRRYPTAEAFHRMAGAIGDVREVRRLEIPDKPGVFLFQVDRGQRGPVFVVWERRDELKGEDAPPVPFQWEWGSTRASAMDVLGHAVPAQVAGGRLNLAISLTPIFIEP